MKKNGLLLGVVTLIITFGLAACSSSNSKSETATYVMNQDEMNHEATFTHVGDKLTKVDQTMEYPLSYFGVEDELTDEMKEQINEQITSQYGEYDGGEGTSLKTTFTEDALRIEMSLDLKKADNAAISSLIVGSDSNNISFEQTVADFEAQGYTKK